jgi:C4-dicarboxylate-specific signal transduction histidine kinase
LGSLREPETLLPVQGDRVELQQVVLNLIINAIEAMSAMSEGRRELLVSTKTTEAGGVLIWVRDSGPGLMPGAHENLFKAFHTTEPNGLGLGLSICGSIVEQHGGRLWASANAPRGAFFQFTLPSGAPFGTGRYLRIPAEDRSRCGADIADRGCGRGS